MEHQIKQLLLEFYSAAIHNHKQKEEKMEILELFFSKIQSQSRDINLKLKYKKGNQCQTQATIKDHEVYQNGSKQANTFSSKLFGTIFLSKIHESQNIETINNGFNVNTNRTFTDPFLFKVIIYALFINLLHIRKFISEKQNTCNLRYSRQNAYEILRKLKLSMVTVAQSFKIADRKKYCKIRYLHNQLLYYTQRSECMNQEYIRVIVEQFDNDYLQLVFDNLELKHNQFAYSQSMKSLESFGYSNLMRTIIVSEVEKALSYLGVQLVLLQEGCNLKIGQQKYNLVIVIEEVPQCSFKLKEIMTFRQKEAY